jgi:ubiquinone/menaquinone biosynthesis C-methylase UbiE
MKKLLRCIQCHTLLSPKNDSMICENGHIYPLINGNIPILREKVDYGHYAHQLDFFSKEFSRSKGYKLQPWMCKYVDVAIQHLGAPDGEATVLDVGAGSGYISIELARAGWHVVALDLTPESMINLVQTANHEGLSEKITPVVGSALDLPIMDNCIDAVVGNAIIEHLPDDDIFVSELARVSTAHARGMLVAPIKLKYVWPFFWAVNYYHDRRIGHLRRYDRRSFETLLSRHDFIVDNVSYSGHFIKVVGTLMQMLLKMNRYGEWLETIDARSIHRVYGSSNVMVTFHM